MVRHVRASSDRARYTHRQTGWPMLCAALLPFLILAARASVRPEPWLDLRSMLAPLLIGFSVLALCFSRLTTVVTDRYFAFRFGIGLVRRAIPLDRIRDVTVGRSRWYEGWGVHWTRRGMLYNVGGFAVVAIELEGGRRLRVGSDDAVRLRGAIARAVERARDAPRAGPTR